MNKSIFVTAIAAASLFTVAGAQAQGFYIFGEAGNTEATSSEAKDRVQTEQIKKSKDTADFNELISGYPDGTVDANGDVLVADVTQVDSISSDDSGTTFSGGVGYNFNKYFATEFAYRDLADTEYEGTSKITGTNASGVGTYKESFESDAFILRGVGILPLTERLSLEGLVGVAYVSTDYSYSHAVDAQGYLQNEADSGSADGSDFSATYGVGATFDVTDSLTAYARWERIHDIDTESEFGGIEADTASAGIRYYF